ncbi:MFS transporter [Myxococcota bacterium]|nr:MFS transporter [Myxococcota bacterium]MBU1431130.1 MFS transporter [Myxococcota bacterium]MBU1899565.1 MFS transporter [Myxococcota bacterium]
MSPSSPASGARAPGWPTQITLLAASSLTVMAGAIISPALPGVRAAFADVPGVDLLALLTLTLPALLIGLFGLPTAALIRRYGARPILLGGALLYALAGSAGLWVKGIEALLVSRAALGISTAALMTVVTVLAGALFDEAPRARFLGLQAASMGFGGVIYLALGGALAAIHWRGPFGVYALALLLIPLIAWSLPPGAREAPEAASSTPTPPPRLARIFTASFIGSVGFYALPTQLPFFLTDGLHLSDPRLAGGLLAWMTLVASLVSLNFARVLRLLASPRRARALTYLFIGVGVAATGLARGPWGVAAAMLSLGLGMGLFMPLLMQAILSAAQGPHRARAAGLLTTTMFLGQFTSPLLSAPLVNAGGFPLMFGVIGVAVCCLALRA